MKTIQCLFYCVCVNAECTENFLLFISRWSKWILYFEFCIRDKYNEFALLPNIKLHLCVGLTKQNENSLFLLFTFKWQKKIRWSIRNRGSLFYSFHFEMIMQFWYVISFMNSVLLVPRISINKIKQNNKYIKHLTWL